MGATPAYLGASTIGEVDPACSPDGTPFVLVEILLNVENGCAHHAAVSLTPAMAKTLALKLLAAAVTEADAN